MKFMVLLRWTAIATNERARFESAGKKLQVKRYEIDSPTRFIICLLVAMEAVTSHAGSVNTPLHSSEVRMLRDSPT